MRSSLSPAVALVVGLAPLGGCGYSEDPEPHSDISRAGTTVSLVDPNQADLLLWVSNQSFDEEQVRITVRIDGETLVDTDFTSKASTTG